MSEKIKICLKKKVSTITNPEIKTYSCFDDLRNSDIYEDKLIATALFDILEKLTKKSENGQIYILSKENETLDNQKYILQNWSTFKKFFDLPNRLKRNQKFVSQVIKHMINQTNIKYQFSNPIIIKTRQQSYLYRDQLNQQKETKITFTEIQL
jgi:hypothetical protein